jgi:hypothetical protein
MVSTKRVALYIIGKVLGGVVVGALAVFVLSWGEEEITKFEISIGVALGSAFVLWGESLAWWVFRLFFPHSRWR